MIKKMAAKACGKDQPPPSYLGRGYAYYDSTTIFRTMVASDRMAKNTIRKSATQMRLIQITLPKSVSILQGHNNPNKKVWRICQLLVYSDEGEL